jgi:hypothetical protein
MSWNVHRVSALSRVVVAGPLNSQSDADTTRAALSLNDPGVKYEVVQEGAGAAAGADGVAVDASITNPAGGGDVTVSTGLDFTNPDTSSDVTRDPVAVP